MSGSTPRDVLALTTDPAALDALLEGYTGDLVVDTFAGPGGWTAGILDLLADFDLREVALEWDEAAVATRLANGLTDVLRCDVAAYPVAAFLRWCVVGYLGSPPCQTFSQAGGKSGVEHLGELAQAAYDVLTGARTLDEALAGLKALGALDDPKTGHADPRNGLILQPSRWLRELGAADPASPLKWCALEQVPNARIVYEAIAAALRALGWRTAIVVTLNAADYGVPQTRERVYLLAHRTLALTVPEPTHTRGGEPASMFGPGRLSWVSMARALGWTAGELVGFPRRPEPSDTEAERITVGAEEYRRRDLAPVDGPALAVTAKGRSWARFVPNDRKGATVRGVEEPAPTLTGGHHAAERRWEPGSEEAGRFLLNRRAGKASPTMTSRSYGAGVFSIEDRLAGNPDVGEGGAWAEDRPATVVASREIVQHPGATANRHNDSAKTRNDGLRVTTAEGAILQGFPADYVWTGTKSKAWEQIGNVVCPPVARRVVAELLGVEEVEPLPWHVYAFTDAPPAAAEATVVSTEANTTPSERGAKVIDRARERMVRDLDNLPPDESALF